MTEKTSGEIQLQIISKRQLITELGAVVKFEVVFKGCPHTVYSTVPTNTGLEACVKDIVSAEESVKDPLVVGEACEGITPEQFIEDGSNKFIEDVRANRYSPGKQQSVFDPLVKQRAMGRLFAEAERTNGHKAKVF